MKYFKILFSIVLIIILSCTNQNKLDPKQGYFEMPDGKIWYEVYGTGNSTPLLLIHGGPGGYMCGMFTIKNVCDNRSLIFYDQLGSGRSEITVDTTLWQLPYFVRNLDRLIDSLKINEVHLLGHSWGASIAVEYYLTDSTNKVKSMILAGPLLSTKLWIEDANYLRSQLPDSIQSVLSYHEKNGSIDSEEYLSATSYFYSRYNQLQPIPENINCDNGKSNEAIYNYMWGPTEFYATGNLRDYDRIDRLDEINVPVLIIVGEYDEARPETMEKVKKLFPNAMLEVIKDAAHASFNDKPDEFNRIVDNFINSIE